MPKWFLSGNTLFAAVHLFGLAQAEEHAAVAFGGVARIADSLDEQLQQKLGGRPFRRTSTNPLESLSGLSLEVAPTSSRWSAVEGDVGAL